MSTYIDTKERPAYGQARDHGVRWEEHTLERLAWIYGPQEAIERLRGRHPGTRADVAAWKALGRKAAA